MQTMRVIYHMDGITPRKAIDAAAFMAQRHSRPLRPINNPLFLKIEPTNYCDLKCPGCGTQHPREKARCPVSISSNFDSLDPERIERRLGSGLEHPIFCIDGATRETHCRYHVDSD
jgi:MoaA/NifB/PqqE/SkfB family radical SAM enzyme